MKNEKTFRPDRIFSYFRVEWLPLAFVTLSGLSYNIGLLATPWFEGRLAQCLADILSGSETAAQMALLVLAYILVTLLVQASRFIKRFYVRRFANNINRRMKGILYANLVRQSRASLEKEGAGELMTKAISDVDDCVEGMRKFTTEVFDTGVALAGHVVMLLVYDWRLALLSLLFTPFSYICAAWMKKPVQRAGAAYKKAAGALSTATLDRARNAVTHRLLTAGTVLCAAASVAASLVPPLLLARIIDGLTAGLPLTFPAVLLYFGSLALEGMLSSAQEGLLVLFGQKMTHALRSEMSRKLTKLPASTLAGQNPGEVAARFSGDVDTVEALFTSGIISMAADACRILSIMAVIAVKNTGLALILLLVLPLFAAFTRHVQTRMLAAQLDNRRAAAAVSGQVPETLHNIRTIRALGLEDYMEHRYDRCIGESYAAMERTNFYDAIYSPVVLVLNAAVVGIVMLLSASGNAAVLTLFGMSVGTSVAVINYISRIFAPIESLGMEIQTIQSAMAGVKRIDAFLDQPERTIPKERETSARGDVVLSHVTFGYGEKQVLNDFSMTVKQGEQVTLVGRTGAGKSTVFKLLLGLYHPETGSVTIGGVDVADITDAERRTCIGCVEQHFARVPGTVLEQITLGDPGITEEMARNAAKLAGLDAAIQTLPNGYDTVCADGMFSQGEWQLLSIARAAAADPAVLLLDEITANLDAETEARVLEALRRASEGRTVLSVSHRIYENLGGRTVEVRTQNA